MKCECEFVNWSCATGALEIWDQIAYGPGWEPSHSIWIIPGTYEEYE